MKTLLKILIAAGSLLAISYLNIGIEVSGFYIALIVALVLGVINVTLKPLMVVLTLPINIITLGLFTFVINALLFWFVASFIDGFSVGGFAPAFIGALILSVISTLSNKLVKTI